MTTGRSLPVPDEDQGEDQDEDEHKDEAKEGNEDNDDHSLSVISILGNDDKELGLGQGLGGECVNNKEQFYYPYNEQAVTNTPVTNASVTDAPVIDAPFTDAEERGGQGRRRRRWRWRWR
jgi:hypothetical protein